MAKVIDIKTRTAVPTEPLSRAKRVVLGVKDCNLKYGRDECCVTVVRIAAAFEEIAKAEPGTYHPQLVTFATASLAEIDSLINKLEGKR